MAYTSTLNFGPYGDYGNISSQVPAPQSGPTSNDLWGQGIGAAGSIFGAAMSAGAQNKATAAQALSGQQALEYQKQLEADRKANYLKAMAAYEQQYQAWNGNRMALLQRYGIDIGATPQAAAPQVSESQAAPMDRNLGDMITNRQVR